MQIEVLIVTQNSHSGLSTCMVKSEGEQVGTAGLKSRNSSQQVNTAVSISENASLDRFWSCLPTDETML